MGIERQIPRFARDDCLGQPGMTKEGRVGAFISIRAYRV